MLLAFKGGESMDVNTITQLITTLGFPIVCVIAMAWFIYKFYNDGQKQNAENMEMS